MTTISHDSFINTVIYPPIKNSNIIRNDDYLIKVDESWKIFRGRVLDTQFNQNQNLLIAIWNSIRSGVFPFMSYEMKSNLSKEESQYINTITETINQFDKQAFLIDILKRSSFIKNPTQYLTKMFQDSGNTDIRNFLNSNEYADSIAILMKKAGISLERVRFLQSWEQYVPMYMMSDSMANFENLCTSAIEAFKTHNISDSLYLNFAQIEEQVASDFREDYLSNCMEIYINFDNKAIALSTLYIDNTLHNPIIQYAIKTADLSTISDVFMYFNLSGLFIANPIELQEMVFNLCKNKEHAEEIISAIEDIILMDGGLYE